MDWGGGNHIPGGSHGSLLATDSLGTLLTVGLDGERPEREQWAISDVYGLIEGHFGLDPVAGDAPDTTAAADLLQTGGRASRLRAPAAPTARG